MTAASRRSPPPTRATSHRCGPVRSRPLTPAAPSGAPPRRLTAWPPAAAMGRGPADAIRSSIEKGGSPVEARTERVLCSARHAAAGGGACPSMRDSQESMPDGHAAPWLDCRAGARRPQQQINALAWLNQNHAPQPRGRTRRRSHPGHTTPPHTRARARHIRVGAHLLSALCGHARLVPSPPALTLRPRS